MKFFDSKEEVLDIQLTQYGRHLLSKGVWKPEYYAFFDDNIIYDKQYGGLTENKNSAETRIQDETPLLTTQYSFTGRDGYLFDEAAIETEDPDRAKLDIYEKLNVMPMSLGTTSLESTKTPAFKINFLEGLVEGLEYNLTGALRTENTGSGTVAQYAHQLLKIPQIEMDIEFKISVIDGENSEVSFEVDPALTPGTIYNDDGQVVIGPQQLLFVIEEENAPFDFRNFDIEVYEITGETGPLGEEILVPLSFVKPLEMVENNLLLDRREAEIKAGRLNGAPPELDPTFVQYYFDINVDEEISENIICASISKLGRSGRSLFTDLDIVCPDLAGLPDSGTPISADIYGSDALDEDCPEY